MLDAIRNNPIPVAIGVVVLLLLFSRRGGGGGSTALVPLAQINAADNANARQYLAETARISAQLHDASMSAQVAAFTAYHETRAQIAGQNAMVAGARITENARTATARINANRDIAIAKENVKAGMYSADAAIAASAIREHYATARTFTAESQSTARNAQDNQTALWSNAMRMIPSVVGMF